MFTHKKKPSMIFFSSRILLLGVYDTMHDLICNNDVGGFDAKDRNNVVTKFKMTMDHLTHVDKLLVHFENFR